MNRPSIEGGVTEFTTEQDPIRVNLEQARTALANVVRLTRDQKHPVILACSRYALSYTLRALGYYHKHAEPEQEGTS